MPQVARKGLLLALLVVPLSAGALASCDARDSSDLPDLPILQPAWTAAPTPTFDDRNRLGAWSTDDGIVLMESPIRTESTTVHGIGADGHDIWAVDLDGAYCGSSDIVDAQGRGAVLLNVGNQRCDHVAVIDTHRGSLLWQQPLPEHDPAHPAPVLPRVALDDGVVNTSGPCGTIVRFDADNGERRDPLTSRSGDDFGCQSVGGIADGLTVFHRGPSTVAMSEGKMLWQRRGHLQVNDIVSTDPVVLDQTDARGHRSLTRYNDEGKASGTIGFDPGGSFYGFQVLARADGVLVGSYGALQGSGDPIYAYDVHTGALLWKRQNDRFGAGPLLLGAHDDELVWGQGARNTGPGTALSNDELWVTASDPRDPDTGRTLGRVATGYDRGYGWSVRGDLLLQPRNQGISAYSLDVEGTTSIVRVPAGHTRTTNEPDWAEGDVRPSDVADACTAVGADALRTLGFDPRLPAPVDCQWHDASHSADRHLSVGVLADAPGNRASGLSASDMASKNLAARAEQLGLTRIESVSDFGDEAYASDAGLGFGTATSVNSASPSDGSFSIAVRQGNVSVMVQAAVSADPWSARYGLTPDNLQQAALAAASDVLTAVGRPLKVVPDVEPAAHRPPHACPLGGRDAARLIPRTAPRDVTPAGAGGSHQWCAWSQHYGSELFVATRTVGPSLLVRDTGDLHAHKLVIALLDDPSGVAAGSSSTARRIHGLGDDAVLVSPSYLTYESAAAVVARKGDQLVVVRLWARRDDDVPRHPERQLIAIARRALAR